MSSIPGYTYGTDAVARSPISLDEFENMKKLAMFGEEDIKYLNLTYDIINDQMDDILAAMYGFSATQTYMQYYWTQKGDAKPDQNYINAAKKRLSQWLLVTAKGNYDQKWLDYQYEIGRRHSRQAKNKTDHVNAADVVSFRYMIPGIYFVLYYLKQFFKKKEPSHEIVEKMYDAWLKSVLLQVGLWSQPYIIPGDF